MVKQRMSTADIAAEVGSLRQKGLVGMRVTNVYDINSKTYVIKLARSGEDGQKAMLLVESGIRLHTIEDMPEKSDVPSNFTLKLRKHIRSRRLEDIRQLGLDRIVSLSFGSGETEVKLLLEFYAQGNVILADREYQVLTLLRSHRDDAKGTATMSRHVYPVHTVRLRVPTTVEQVRGALTNAANEATLKVSLVPIIAYGPLVIDFCIRQAGLDPKRMIAMDPLEEKELDCLFVSIQRFERWIDSCEDAAPQGYILSKKSGEYLEYEPMVGDAPLGSCQGEMCLFPTFDDAVSEFYGKIHGQRLETQQKQREKNAKSKLDAIRKDHETRLKNLSREVESAEHKAMVLEGNLDAADAAINSVREALAAGISWNELDVMIKEESKLGNPVAMLVCALKLHSNQVTLQLDDPDTESATTNEKHGTIKIDVDISLSAHANANLYYEAKKKFADKARRTVEANEKALATAEQKALANLEKVQRFGKSGPSAAPPRKPYWFEKFNWFISSENYLVLSGKDAQQNEVLVKRYLKKGDIYVHADLHGASSTIVKNNDPNKPISPLTLTEAGHACVARSAAWDAKVVTSAWWVYPDQVSKTAPSGEYLTTGSMMIRGKKNYLPPQPLVMGIAWLFKLEEGSIAAHLGERASRDLGTLENDTRSTDNLVQSIELPEESDGKEKSAFEKFMESSIDILTTSQTTVIKAKGRQNPQPKKFTKGDNGTTAAKTLDNVSKSEEKFLTSKRTSKNKKALKKKYKDQDEEERQLAMALLQPDGKKKDKKTKREERKARMAARKAQASGVQNTPVTQDHIEKLTARMHLDDNESEASNNSKGSQGKEQETGLVNNQQHQTSFRHVDTVQSESIIEEELNLSEERSDIQSDEGDIAQLLEEEGVGLLEEEEKDKLTVLDELTGIPRSEDTLLYAIPVCAPYQVVSSYKYHVKLVPGTQKKGKAYRQAMEIVTTFSKSAKQSGPNQQDMASVQREKDLIRQIPELEGIHAMVGAVKLQVAGLQKLQQAKKKASKKKS